jgi:hypothetical protein
MGNPGLIDLGLKVLKVSILASYSGVTLAPPTLPYRAASCAFTHEPGKVANATEVVGTTRSFLLEKTLGRKGLSIGGFPVSSAPQFDLSYIWRTVCTELITSASTLSTNSGQVVWQRHPKY